MRALVKHLNDSPFGKPEGGVRVDQQHAGEPARSCEYRVADYGYELGAVASPSPEATSPKKKGLKS
jgi:hypothetical protein